MEAADIISFIQSTGFPIAACVFMYLQSTQSIGKVTEAINDMRLAITKLEASIDQLMKTEK